MSSRVSLLLVLASSNFAARFPVTPLPWVVATFFTIGVEDLRRSWPVSGHLSEDCCTGQAYNGEIVISGGSSSSSSSSRSSSSSTSSSSSSSSSRRPPPYQPPPHILL